MDFGWKKKAEHLRMVILSAGHRTARELPPGMSRVLELFGRVAQTDDGRNLQEELARVPPDADPPLWEPAEIYGWKVQATMYLRDGDLWWLVHAARKNERTPSEKDLVFLDKVLDSLGAVPARHAIIGPRSSPTGEPPLPFGWWTWRNRDQLYDVQVNKDKKRDADKIRIVPLGARETEGYVTLPGARAATGEEKK